MATLKAWLAKLKPLGKKLIFKGIMTAEDAAKALELGADAIWISNRQGMMQDTVASSINVLKKVSKVVKELNPEVPVLFDGGVRRGSDMIKALALGADFCFIGQPAIWALQQAGSEGVNYMLEILKKEMEGNMILLDTLNVDQISEERNIAKIRPRL